MAPKGRRERNQPGEDSRPSKTLRQTLSRDPVPKPQVHGEDSSHDSEDDPLYETSDRDEEEGRDDPQEVQGEGVSGHSETGNVSGFWQIRRGRNGRFVSSQGSGSASTSKKKSKFVDDGSWLVQGNLDGGPSNASVIPSFCGHVASYIWTGNEKDVLVCCNRLSSCHQLAAWEEQFNPRVQGRSDDMARVWNIVEKSGLLHLHSTMFDHIDVALISAFVERWQPDTNSFHLPFGEMTIMLHDVWYLLRVPVDGIPVSGSQKKNDDLVAECAAILGSTKAELIKKKSWTYSGLTDESIVTECRDNQYRAPENHAMGFLLLTLGATLFVNKSGSRLCPANIIEVRDLDNVSRYSWGSATLAYLYRQLGIASRAESKVIAGCLTLLQAWIYEYFPCFRPLPNRLVIAEHDPRALQWPSRIEPKTYQRLVTIRNRIDALVEDEVNFCPFGQDPSIEVPRTTYFGYIRHHNIIEPYRPDRVLRQLGRVQCIPSPIPVPMRVCRAADPRRYVVEHCPLTMDAMWRVFPVSSFITLNRYPLFTADRTMENDYLAWHQAHSHPYVVNPKDVATAMGDQRHMDESWCNWWSRTADCLFSPELEQLPESDIKHKLINLRIPLKRFNNIMGFRRSSPMA